MGDECTLVDVYLAGILSPAFQTCLDAGFQKGMPAVTSWFNRITKLPPFVAAFGYVKACAKPIKAPKLPVKEKPKVVEKKPAEAAAKPKPAAEEQKKPKNPLDALPPTNFVIDDYKRVFSNLSDKYGEGHENMMSTVDHAGWSFWLLHYEKVGKEGQVGYMFQNMLEGFCQRLEGFKKYSMGKFCMLGEEPSLEIKGVLLMRGHDINVQELKDHPQMEYMQPRKLDIANAADKKIIQEYFGSADGGQCDGMKCQVSMWHK